MKTIPRPTPAALAALEARLRELLRAIIGCETESDVFGALEDAAHFARQAQEALDALLAAARHGAGDTERIAALVRTAWEHRPSDHWSWTALEEEFDLLGVQAARSPLPSPTNGAA